MGKSLGVQAANPAPPANIVNASAIAASAGPIRKDGGGPPPGPQKLYFVNAWVDFAIIGGLSIVAFILFRLFGPPERVDSPLAGLIAGWLVLVINNPHFSATNYRLYHSRENIMQYPITALVIPWFILTALFASALLPNLVAPYFVKIYIIWSPYHFSGQTVGITLIYARRAGFRVATWERLGLSAFVFGSYAYITSLRDTFPDGEMFQAVQMPSLGLPTWVPEVFKYIMYAGGALFLGRVIAWCRTNRKILPPIVLLPAVAQYVWFVQGGTWNGFNAFVPGFHSLQYLLIAWSMQLKEKMDQKHIPPSVGYVAEESTRWGILNLIGGWLMFFAFPFVFGMVMGIAPFLAATLTSVAVQMHHFFVDGVIWKLKRKTVSSPLMVNIEDMIHAPTPKAA
jgi:hypothetical protein